MSRARRVALVGLAGLSIATFFGCGLEEVAGDKSDESMVEPGDIRVEVVAPTPPGGEKAKPGPGSQDDPEACRTGCSLAKHAIPEFRRGDFEKAMRAYGNEAAEAPSEALEKLLFYSAETRHFIDKHGTGSLSAEHAAFLTRELRRRYAIVEIRMVEADGRVRVSYGPEQVPLGQKEHLQPKGHDLQPFEINGTVMRTGLYHLWSRY